MRLKDSRINHPSINRFIPPEHDAAEDFELPEIDGDSTPEEVENVIAHMIDYLLKWTDEKLIEGPATILQDIRSIHDSLQNIMELPEDVISSSVVRSALRTLRKRYEIFVSTWAQAVHSSFNGKLLHTELQLKRHPASLLESEFTSFVSNISTASSSHALLVLLNSTQDNIRLLVSESVAKKLLDRSTRLHEIFQNATYVSEQKQLWLLIWRSLKTVFTAFEQGGAPTSPTNIERDRKFFELPGIYRELKRLVSSPDAANPRSIEDMVGKYCRYIYKCQVDPGNKYESLQRPRNAPLESHTREALREFIQTGRFEMSTLSKIHFAVARFNEISGGPVKVRRWYHDAGNREWEIVALDLLSPALRLTAERRPSYSNVPSTAGSHPSFGDATQRRPKRLFPHPQGVNMKSAFDYVYYPFPETRAHEVVQHEQISREMGQRGIISEGPRAEFLVNRPPRHARDPADLSMSNRGLGPFSLIHMAIQRLLPQRRRAPDARHPKINTLPARRSPRSSALKPRPLPINSEARVHKSTSTATPKLKLRGGGPLLHRSAAASNRKRAFDPLAYRRMMMAIFRRELKSKYGRAFTLDEHQMLRLLNFTTYDVRKAVQLYQTPSRDKSIGPDESMVDQPRQSVRAGRVVSHQTASKMNKHRRLFRRMPAGNNAEIYAYRVNSVAQPIAGPFEALPPGDYGDDDDHNRGDQHLLRPVLGELPVGTDTHDGGSTDNHNREHQTLPRPALGELPLCADPHDGNGSDDDTQHSSNQENHTPRRPEPPQPPHRSPSHASIHWRCHPCPVFEGEYHHVCTCTGVVDPGPTPDFQVHEDENTDERPNSNSSPRSAGRGGGNSANDHGDQAGSQAGSQASHQAEDRSEDQSEDQPVNQAPRRPRREDPREDDGQYVHEVFEHDPGYKNALRDLGSDGALHEVVTDIFAPQPSWTTIPNLRNNLCTTIDVLVTEIMTLRDQYLALLEAPEPFMEAVTQDDVRAPNPDVPATDMICKRATNEMKQHYDRLFQFFDGNQSRPNLGFRHQFNRLIVAVRELRLLFLEYCHAVDAGSMAGNQQKPGRGSGKQGQEDNRGESSDDTHTDSEATLSSLETARVARGRPPPKRINVVPTRAQYELMFVDELEREMGHRGFVNVAQTLGKQRYKKADLIDKLMEFDREGIHLGSGADNGYRRLSGLLTARARPKGFDLEDLIRRDATSRARTRQVLKDVRREERRKARSARGLDTPAPVRPRVPPSGRRLARGARPKVRAGSPEISGQSSEESDTASVDYRRVR